MRVSLTNIFHLCSCFSFELFVRNKEKTYGEVLERPGILNVGQRGLEALELLVNFASGGLRLSNLSKNTACLAKSRISEGEKI